MYFINIKQLKKDIIEKRFSEKDRFIYILVFIMLDTIFLELTFLPITEPNYERSIVEYADSIMTILVTFLGTYFIYKANGGVKGDDFAGKYFSLTWVRSIQFLLFLLPSIIFFFILDAFLFQLAENNNDIISFLFFSIYSFAIYFYSYKDVLEIKAKETE